MNDALKMQISAFVDGELPDNEADLLIRRLGKDGELRRQADAYFAIGRLMRGERSVTGMEQLRIRIASALENEASDSSREITANRFMRPAAGFAIAASVALLALVGLRQVNVPQEPPTLTAANSGVAIDEIAGYTEPDASDVMSDRPSEMLMQYYLSHGETSSELGANGILSRLVTLELRGGELVEVSNDEEPLAPGEPGADNRVDIPADRE